MNNQDLLRGAKKLRFPDLIEREFIREYDRKTVSYGKWLIPLAFVATLSLVLLDFLSFGEKQQTIIMIRLLSFAFFPIAYLLNCFPRFAKYSYLYNSMILITISIGYELILAMISPEERAYQYYFVGVFLLIAVTYTTARLRFYYANIVAAIIVVPFVYVTMFQNENYYDPIARGVLINIYIIIGYFIILCAMTGYFIEYSNRREFVHLKMVEKEKVKSENLLANILPKHITEELLQESIIVTEKHSNVTVLFADLVGFTEFTRTIDSDKLILYLNRIFSYFDDLTERYGLEKIKTIGDNYMVASVGREPHSPQDAAERMARLALEMQRYITRISKQSHYPLTLRIGIHSGPIIAGVIGKKKFTYDIWGDTVNIASRMESEAIDGTIQVTQTTYQLLDESFQFQERGMIEVKGIGKVRAYVLVGTSQ
ncbi:adenylate/guanylate cyclase domain-containing protein [Niallia sp. Krafla_26]|uniref:adenylate/guanylate cyclase domain-containing protein n=1 Tax=Niallia sp. Krafla_26 TaxID=3064703 RepID=UPI003D18069D